MKGKALFISEDEQEWDLFERLFKAHFKQIELSSVKKSDAAEEQLKYQGPYHLVVIDCSLRQESPGEIFTLANAITNNFPVIFYGPERLLRTRVPEDIYDFNESNALLESPVEVPEFRETIGTALAFHQAKEEEAATIEVDKDNYVPMKIKNFYRFKTLPYDGYLELSSTKFIRIINKGEEYGHEFIQKYIKKRIKYIWLEKVEHLKYLENAAQTLLKLLHKKIEPFESFAFQVKSIAVIHEYIRTIGVGETVVELKDAIIQSVDNILTEVGSLKELMTIFPWDQKDTAERSILTCYVNLAMVRNMSWHSDMTRDKLGLASIIHDCFLNNEDMVPIRSVNDYRLYNYPEEDQIDYKEHPLRAAEVAMLFPGMVEPDFIIAQHHEHPSGDGFPRGLNHAQLTGLACIFIVANNFVNFLQQGELSTKNVFRGLDFVYEYYNEGNFKESVKVLRNLFKR